MNSHWDDILEKLEKLDRDAERIGELLTCVSSEVEHLQIALEQVRADQNKTKKQAATLRALTPSRQFSRAG
jgi:hypothetical protein